MSHSIFLPAILAVAIQAALSWEKFFSILTMSLRIIATGGTFDKHYDPLTGHLYFRDSVLPGALKRARIAQDCVFEALLALDSLDMLDEHRKQVLQSCQRSTEDHIVIVHGTDTMRETAAVLGAAQLNKTIVLTGAMVPYLVDESDAFFNLGFACAAARLSKPGVYIAMNGQLFDWDNVKKNREQGCFEALR
ncbi:MAG: hypothetical protein RL404_672 [Pseudomonadota bacterium]